MTSFTKVAKQSEIPKGSGKVVEVGGKVLALFHSEDQFYATENTCRHQGGPLGEGSLSGTTVTCPWHGWEYDVTTGACQLDASVKVATFPVKVDGDDILVAL